MNKNILIFLSVSDFNESEYSVCRHYFEKNKYQIFIASDAVNLCSGKNGLKVKPDIQLYNVHESNFAALIIIGGSGIKNYWNDKKLISIVQKFHAAKKYLAAICSAPVILSNAGILSGKKCVCYPADRPELEKNGAVYVDSCIVVSENILTGRDSNSSTNFSQELLKMLSNLT